MFIFLFRDALLITSNRSDEVKMVKLVDDEWRVVECEDESVIKFNDDGRYQREFIIVKYA